MLGNLFRQVGKGTGSVPGPPASTKINLGCGRKTRAGWVNLDSQALPGIDVVADLDACRTTPLPFPDDSFAELYASHVLEHLRDPLALMQELHRIAKPDARIEFRVPYGSSDEADTDPTHARRYFFGSFNYFALPAHHDFDYGYRGDWETEKIQLIVDGARHKGKTDAAVWDAIRTYRNVVLEMRAWLRAVKPARTPSGPWQHHPSTEIVRAEVKVAGGGT